MSSLGDAFEALRNVILMQERIDAMRGDHQQMAADLRTLTEKVLSLNERVVRIETMIEMSRGGGTRGSLTGPG